MAISLQDFSKLLVQSKLMTDEQCRRYLAKFSKEAGQQEASAKSAAEWLLRQKLISKYQASILLAGRPGPFVFGAYKIIERIETGRLNKIFRAVHASTNHAVLMKLVSGSAIENKRVWDDMLHRVSATSHPNLTRSYELLDQGKNKFLVMQDLRGESLAEVLIRKKRIAPDEACRLIRSAAIGLSWLHEQRIVHGDVRPHNLWLEQDKTLKVLVEPDVGTRGFDLASAASEADGIARSDYAAPEFTQAGRMPDPLTDVYALGCSFYELVSGNPPFAGGDVQQKLQRHATEPIQPLDSLGVPSQLVQRIAYMMAKNPAVRYQSVQIVADQLAQFVPSTQPTVVSSADSSGAAGFEGWLEQKQPAPSAQLTETSQPSGGTVPVAAERPVVPLSPAASQTPGAGSEAPSVQIAQDHSALPAIEIKRRGKARRKSNMLPLVASLVILLVAIAGGIFIWKNPSLWKSQEVAQPDPNGNSPPKVPDVDSQKPVIAATSTADPVDVPGSKTSIGNAGRELSATLVDDDGQSLWGSPTEGPAINLKYVPPGVQLLLVARPADILASQEGQRVLKALGPQFETARSRWESLAGVKLEDVEQLILALYPNRGELPRSAFVVRLKSDAETAQLLPKWGQPSLVEGQNGISGIYQKDAWAYFVPEDDKRTFVMGPFDPLLKDAASAGWQVPLLRREIGELVQLSDANRHLTVLFTPTFLLGDGRTLFTGDAARAVPTFERLLGDGVHAAALSLHFADQFYFELRMESDIEIDRQQLASQIRERISKMPEATELYVANLNPHPYWRLVANRYPGMVRFLHQQSRIGVEGNHAIVNAVLPGIAAHNLVFGGEMLLASEPGITVAAAGPASNGTGPKNIDDVLKSKISISFDQDSLEFAMQNVASEVTSAFPNLGFEFKIKILGTDLEKDGITRNQQVRDFKQEDKSVAEVLTAMVRKANPITTVKEPNELDQKLVWVVGPDPDNAANKIVLVTTRAASDQKKYVLPDVFRPK